MGRETAPAIVHDVLSQPGRRLSDGIRIDAERVVGYDLSNVRVHDGALAERSADAISARAYAVANHVVLGRDGFRPESSAGRSLLLHELTHVRQQASDHVPSKLEIAPSNDDAEREARSTAAGVMPAGPIGSRSGMIQRDEMTDEEAGQAAVSAMLRCDLMTVCRLRMRHPGGVPSSLVDQATRSCGRPVGAGVDPCLAIMLRPSLTPPPGTPAPGPQLPGPRRTPAPSGGGTPGGLSNLLNFTLRAGDLTLSVDLPSQVKARLPLQFRDGVRLTFELSGTRSGVFRFSARLDGIPHVTVTLQAGVNIESGMATAGIVFGSRRQSCQVRDPASTRSAIERAGNQIQTAVRALQDSPAEESREARLGEIVSGISSIHSAIEAARGPCRPLPSVEFEFGTRIPIRPDEGTGPRRPENAPFLGGGATLRF